MWRLVCALIFFGAVSGLFSGGASIVNPAVISALTPDYVEVSSLVGVLGTLALMTSPIAGMAADRFGRRAVLVVAVLVWIFASSLQLLSALIWPVGNTQLMFTSGIVICALGASATNTLFYTVLTDMGEAHPEKLGLLMAVYAVSVSVGGIVAVQGDGPTACSSRTPPFTSGSR